MATQSNLKPPVRLVSIFFAAGALVTVWSFLSLDVSIRELIPETSRFDVAKEFLARALSPALDYESDSVPEGTPPLLLKALRSAGTTVLLAGAALGIALLIGLPMGVLSSHQWWLESGEVGQRGRSIG